MLKPLTICGAIFLLSPPALADIVGEITGAFNFTSTIESNEDQVLWEKTVASKYANISELFVLANKPGHFLAKNYAGCALANGLGTKQNMDRALVYFDQAKSSNLLSLYNYGLLNYLSGNPTKASIGLKAIGEAYNKGGFEEAGVWLLIDGTKKRQVNIQIVDQLAAIRSPVGFYYKALSLKEQGNYQEALRYSKMGAELSDLNNIALTSQIYQSLPNDGQVNRALVWAYAHKIMSGPDLGMSPMKTTFVTFEDKAWNEAVSWSAGRQRRVYDYKKALCKQNLTVLNRN